MKSITIYCSLLLLFFYGTANANTPTNNLDEIAAQFTAMVENNKKNDSLGLSENNKYIFSISFEEDDAIVSTDCGGWVKPYENGQLGGLHDDYEPICADYIEFNNDNTSNLQHYIVFIEFPNIAFETNYTQGQIGSASAWDYFMANIGDTDKALYQTMITELRAKLPDLNGGSTGDLVFGNEKEQLVSVLGKYSYKNNGDEYHRVLQSYDFTESDFLNKNFIRKFKKEVKEKAIPEFSLEILMETTIDFFSKSLNPQMSCTELSAFFNEPQVVAYWDGWCTALENNSYPGISLDYIQTNVWPICVYFENYLFLGGTIDQDIDEDFLYYSPEEFLAYLNSDLEDGYLSRLDKLIDDLNAECNPPQWTGVNAKKTIQAITEIIRSPDADVNFYKQLNADELTCLTKLYLGFYNTTFEGWLINEDYYFLQAVFNAIKTKDPQECKDFLDAIFLVENSTSRMFAACDELFTFQPTEFELVSLISDVVLKANYVTSNELSDYEQGGKYDGRLYGWKPAAFFLNLGEAGCVLKKNHVDYHYDISDGQNNIEFRFDYHAGFAESASSTLIPPWGEICTRNGPGVWDNTEYANYHPFAVVGVIGKADQVTIFTDCSSYQCKMPLTGMSAFQLAWMIEKKDDDDAFDSAILAIEIASSAVGVSQAMAAWKTGAAIRAGFLGMTATGELIGSSLTQSIIESIGADLGEAEFAHAQKINQVLGFVALGSGVGQVGLSLVDAIRAQTVASNLTKSGISFESSPELAKRLADLRTIIDESPVLFSKALSDAKVSNEIIDKLNAISDLEQRITVGGHILISPNMVQKVNANPELFDFFESLASSTYVDNAKYVLKLTDTEMESVASKLDASGNPDLISFASSSDELTYLILRAEKKNIDVFSYLGQPDLIDDFDDFLSSLDNNNFYNFLKNAQNTLDFEKSMVTWSVLVSVPDEIRYNALNLQKVYDHIDIYGGAKSNFDTPIKSHQQWIDDLATSDTPYPSATTYLPEGYPEITYLPNYVNVEKGELISIEGFFKYPYEIIDIPDEVLAKLKHDEFSNLVDPTDYIVLIEEYNVIQRLHYLGFPVSDYVGIVKHHGVASLVTKKYATGLKSAIDFNDINNALITNDGLGDLSFIRDKIIDYNIEIDDLQYLITDEGRIVIHDPLPNPTYTEGEFAGLIPADPSYNFTINSFVNPVMKEMINRLLINSLENNGLYTVDDLLVVLDNKVSINFLEDIYLNNGYNTSLFTFENGIFKKK